MIWLEQQAMDWNEVLPLGNVDGLRARGGFEVSLQWADGKLVSASILSSLEALCTLRYADQSLTRPCSAGERFSLNADFGVV